MSKPCEYCGVDLPLGADKETRRVRSFHFASCEKRRSLDMNTQTEVALCAQVLEAAQCAEEGDDHVEISKEACYRIFMILKHFEEVEGQRDDLLKVLKSTRAFIHSVARYDGLLERVNGAIRAVEEEL